MPDCNRPDHLIVIADHSRGAHVTDSEEIFWWLPVIGPGSAFLAFLLARHARHADTTWDTTELAMSIGLGGNRSTLWQRLDRLAMFGLVNFVSTDVVTIRLELPPLKPRQLERLPESLAAAYRSAVAA